MHEKAQPLKKVEEYVRHKSVDNAKQYAINKIIGKLNTKRELERVGTTKISMKAAQKQLTVRYKEEAEKRRSNIRVNMSHDESKSSFTQRFEKH